MRGSSPVRWSITTKEDYVMNEAEQNIETVRRGYAAFNSADNSLLSAFS